MPKAENFRPVKAEELKRVTAEQLRTFDADDMRDVTVEELAELCEAPGDLGCADQFKAAATDRQALNNKEFLARHPGK